MEKILSIIAEILPYALLAILIIFGFSLVSYFVGVVKAKKHDPTIQLALNKPGKIVMGIIFGLFFIGIVVTLTQEIRIIANSELTGSEKLSLALQAPNFLTVITFLCATEVQDIYFIGQKNVFIGNRMFEFRRMRKVGYPKKYQMSFVYGQKEYTYSTRFVDMQLLKTKFTRLQ